MKKIFAMILLCGATMAIEAQEISTTIGSDIVSSYIWRGQDLGGVSLQPTLGLEYKGISLSAWGSVGLADPADTKEFDITLGYTIGGLNIGITDYWFNAGAHGTNHVFEANIGYDFGVVSAQWYTNISGNDGVNKDGKRAYSSYFEVAAPFKLATCDWTATVGAVPFATNFYGTNGFAVTNLAVRASKDIKVTDSFSIPIFGEVSANPCSQKAYLVVGMSFGL